MATSKSSKKGPKSMTPEHKEALAEGRSQSRAIRNYLEALEANRPKRGRKRTPDSIRKRLATLAQAIPEADPAKRVVLIQERLDLENELGSLEASNDLQELEAGFIEHAAGYSERKGISYAAWRETGVPASVLKAAGIGRGNS